MSDIGPLLDGLKLTALMLELESHETPKFRPERRALEDTFGIPEAIC
jgi:hypothetical protein